MPGPVGINVGGAYIVRPGVFSLIDASAMVPNRPGPGGIVGVVGLADGGTPGVVWEFSSYAEAAAVLRRGDALSYLRRIFSPAPDLPGASMVRFVRMGTTTQGSLAVAGMTVTSRDYGRHVNGISVKIAAGTGSTWDVTIRKPADGYNRTYNVGLALNIKCSATLPKIVFDHALKEAKLYENAVVVATLPYPTESVTLMNLAAWINGRAGWTATVTGDGSMPVCYMDNPLLASAPAILATDVAIPANQGYLQWVLARDEHVSASLTTGTTFATLSVAAEAPLAGGTGTGFDSITASDFDAPLTLLEAVQVHHVFLCSSDAAVQAKGLAHTVNMRLVNRKRWRIYYTGGTKGETSAQAIANAQKLDGPVVYGWNGTADAHPETGLPEQLGGLGFAAQLCGMAAGTPAATPLTNKAVRSTALEVPSPSDSTIDALLVGGVTPCAYDTTTGRATIVQAITTWQGGANVAYRKLVGLRIQDEINRGYQRVLSEVVGEPLDLMTGVRIRDKMAKFLDSSVRSSRNPDGFLTQGFRGGFPTPAWENLQVTSDGMDLWTLNVEAHPVGESAYVLVRTKLTPASIEV